jgi:xylulokinase
VNYFLGIDVGTTGCKAILVDENGELIAKGVEEYPLYTPRPNWAEQDPSDWWQGTQQAIKKTLDSVSIDRKAIVGIGLTGQMHGSILKIH